MTAAFAEDQAAKGGSGPGVAPRYSGTNTHEAGVDEPDLVKTDGRRIVTRRRRERSGWSTRPAAG